MELSFLPIANRLRLILRLLLRFPKEEQSGRVNTPAKNTMTCRNGDAPRTSAGTARSMYATHTLLRRRPARIIMFLVRRVETRGTGCGVPATGISIATCYDGGVGAWDVDGDVRRRRRPQHGIRSCVGARRYET